MNRKVMVLIGLVLVLLVLLIPGTLYPQLLQSAPARTPTPSGLVTPGGPEPTLENVVLPSQVKDLDPNVPRNQKTEYVVRHPNGEREWFLVPPRMSLEDFKKLLGSGDIIETYFPLSSYPAVPQTVPPGVFPSRAPGPTPSWFPPPPTQAP